MEGGLKRGRDDLDEDEEQEMEAEAEEARNDRELALATIAAMGFDEEAVQNVLAVLDDGDDLVERAVTMLLMRNSPPRRRAQAVQQIVPRLHLDRGREAEADVPLRRREDHHHVEPMLKQQKRNVEEVLDANRFDLVSSLPVDLVWILSDFLNLRELVTASLVCRGWMSMFGNDELWARRSATTNVCNITSKPVRLELAEGCGVSIMSLVSFRHKIRALLADNFKFDVLSRGLDPTFDLSDIRKIELLDKAEQTSCECCLSINLLAPMSSVMAESLMWVRRRKELMDVVPVNFADSVRFLRSEHHEAEDVGFSHKITFMFRLSNQGSYLCEFVENDLEDGDVSFPTFEFRTLTGQLFGSFTFYPSDIWLDELEVHPLRLFEELRIRWALSKSEAMNLLKALCIIVRKVALWNSAPLRYADVECADCGRIHFNN